MYQKKKEEAIVDDEELEPGVQKVLTSVDKADMWEEPADLFIKCNAF